MDCESGYALCLFGCCRRLSAVCANESRYSTHPVRSSRGGKVDIESQNVRRKLRLDVVLYAGLADSFPDSRMSLQQFVPALNCQAIQLGTNWVEVVENLLQEV